MLAPMFNQTVPELVAQPDELGETLHLSGFAADGDIAFPLPEFAGPLVTVRVGPLDGSFPATLTTLIALPRVKVLVATYRSLFRYLMRPEERRQAVLTWPGNDLSASMAEEIVDHA